MTVELEENLGIIIQEEESEKVASGLHGAIGGILTGNLYMHVYPKNLGWVLNSSTTYNFKDGQPRREPDVSFVSLEKMPELIDDELTFAPDLAVEVVSKTDKTYDTDSKVKQYQQAGVRLIWVVRPLIKLVEVYHLSAGLVPEIVGINGELDGAEVLPGFSIKVSSLFKQSGQVE